MIPQKPGPAAKTARSGSVRNAAADLPLSALLSQVLVAFTIEFDNESERQMQHRTTNQTAKGGGRVGPWLVSMAMWSNCMQFIGERGVRVDELGRLARTATNLNGMQRWGYIIVEPDPNPGDKRPKTPRSHWRIRATASGQRAQEVWRPLFGAIEERWQVRVGKNEIRQLRDSLSAIVQQIDLDLPDCLPILKYGLFSTLPDQKRRAAVESDARGESNLSLPALLSRVLLAFAIEFERESKLSLAISANILRVLDAKGVRLRDLPLLTGVSKEAISMAMGILKKYRIATLEPGTTGSATKIVRLTENGRKLQDAYRQLLGEIETRWRARFGEETIGELRNLLERLVGDATPQSSPLFFGLEPYPEGWRASVRKPETLPHFPMVLHRGGFPDGS
jgi:DNA-binding MarR family transcriptional regulator